MKPGSSLVIPGALGSNPTPGTQRQTPHVIRGGYWRSPSWGLRASDRGWLHLGFRLVNFGSRVVLEML